MEDSGIGGGFPSRAENDSPYGWHSVRTPPAASAKPRYRVTNWRDYNRALVERGSLTLWIDEEVLDGWRATGGKGWRYSDIAIVAALSPSEAETASSVRYWNAS